MKLLLEIMMAGTTAAIIVLLVVLVRKIGRNERENSRD
jgi:beta-lactamase regulating signal transducer with metallopeptidase domain